MYHMFFIHLIRFKIDRKMHFFTASYNIFLKLENDTLNLGQNALFKCHVNNSNGRCTADISWYGENGHKFLCRNEHCENPKKYKETKMNQCTSMLEISDVTLYDITTLLHTFHVSISFS